MIDDLRNTSDKGESDIFILDLCLVPLKLSSLEVKGVFSSYFVLCFMSTGDNTFKDSLEDFIP